MYGTKTLHDLSRQRLSEMTKEEAAAYGINHWNVLQMIEKGDYFMPFIAQYDFRNPPSIEDTFYMGHIKQMIQEGNLLMRYIPCKKWANSDKEFKKNKDLLLENDLFIIDDPNGFEDANFESKEKIDLLRVYLNDEDVPSVIPKYKKYVKGKVEFGTQSIAKTAMALICGYDLIRLPYEIKLKGLDPCFAIFHNKKPFNAFNSINL